MARSQVNLTPDDVIALLRKTQLPTVVIEGDLDALVFRSFEEANASEGLSVLPVGGRTCLLEVFRRKAEIGNSRLVFFADRDVWVYSSLPNEYVADDLIFTDGYSIENDAYRDGDLEQYLSAVEKSAFITDLNRFLNWYAVVLARALSGKQGTISLPPQRVLGPEYDSLAALELGETFPTTLRNSLGADYKRLLRGKSLLKLLLLQLGKNGRAARHSAEALMEIAASSNGALIQNAFSRIRGALGLM